MEQNKEKIELDSSKILNLIETGHFDVNGKDS